MRRVSRNALVPYSAQQMYALVEDVPAYPEFLPWCTGAEVHAKTDTELQASIGLGLGVFNATFTTRNQLNPPVSMSMELLDGPFHALHGRWTFQSLGEQGCEVHLQVDFEFANAAQDLLLGSRFEKVCNELIDAFVRRATHLYADAS